MGALSIILARRALACPARRACGPSIRISKSIPVHRIRSQQHLRQPDRLQGRSFVDVGQWPHIADIITISGGMSRVCNTQAKPAISMAPNGIIEAESSSAVAVESFNESVASGREIALECVE
jgi:hypothetical protein